MRINPPLFGKSRVGHRGAILLILALIDFAYGLSLIVPSAESLSSATVQWREHYAPIAVWGAGWVACGFVLLLYAPRRHDAVGYTIAIGWKIIWGMTSIASWAFGGVPRGWVSAIIWLTFAGMIAVISDWPEPVRVTRGSPLPGDPVGDLVPPPEEGRTVIFPSDEDDE